MKRLGGEFLDHCLFFGGNLIQVVKIAFKSIVLDGFSRRLVGKPNTRLLRSIGGPCSHGGIFADKLTRPIRSLVREMLQLVCLLVFQLPSGPRFHILGLMFPLAVLFLILLQIKDGFCFRDEDNCIRERRVGAFRFALVILKNIDVDGHSRSVGVKPLDNDWKVDCINVMES